MRDGKIRNIPLPLMLMVVAAQQQAKQLHMLKIMVHCQHQIKRDIILKDGIQKSVVVQE